MVIGAIIPQIAAKAFVPSDDCWSSARLAWSGGFVECDRGSPSTAGMALGSRNAHNTSMMMKLQYTFCWFEMEIVRNQTEASGCLRARCCGWTGEPSRCDCTICAASVTKMFLIRQSIIENGVLLPQTALWRCLESEVNAKVHELSASVWCPLKSTNLTATYTALSSYVYVV